MLKYVIFTKNWALWRYFRVPECVEFCRLYDIFTSWAEVYMDDFTECFGFLNFSNFQPLGGIGGQMVVLQNILNIFDFSTFWSLSKIDQYYFWYTGLKIGKIKHIQ